MSILNSRELGPILTNGRLRRFAVWRIRRDMDAHSRRLAQIKVPNRLPDVPGFDALDVSGDFVLGPDLIQHLQHFFIGPAVQRS